jgi:hypothetical protein
MAQFISVLHINISAPPTEERGKEENERRKREERGDSGSLVSLRTVTNTPG